MSNTPALAELSGVMNAERISTIRQMVDEKKSLSQIAALTGLTACTLAGLLREPAETPTRKPIRETKQ